MLQRLQAGGVAPLQIVKQQDQRTALRGKGFNQRQHHMAEAGTGINGKCICREARFTLQQQPQLGHRLTASSSYPSGARESGFSTSPPLPQAARAGAASGCETPSLIPRRVTSAKLIDLAHRQQHPALLQRFNAVAMIEDLPIPDGPPIVTSSGTMFCPTRSNAAMTSFACGCAANRESARWIAGVRSCWPGVKATISPSEVNVA